MLKLVRENSSIIQGYLDLTKKFDLNSFPQSPGSSPIEDIA